MVQFKPYELSLRVSEISTVLQKMIDIDHILTKCKVSSNYLIILSKSVIMKYISAIKWGRKPSSESIVSITVKNDVVVHDCFSVCCVKVVVKTHRKSNFFIGILCKNKPLPINIEMNITNITMSSTNSSEKNPQVQLVQQSNTPTPHPPK